jgi:flagellar hook-associated protein 1
MAGLLDTLSLGARSLQAQRHGIDVAGHNLANVNTPGYARQRVSLAAVTTVDEYGSYIGAGADVVGIESIRDEILDSQVQSERSITGSLAAQEKALQSSLTALNDGVQRSSSVADGVTTGISRTLNELFARFQALSVSPLSTADRQALVMSAQSLGQEFQQVDNRLARVDQALSDELKLGVNQANALLDEISGLNSRIAGAELRSPGSALDLRDARQEKLEQLAKYVPLSISNEDNGSVTVSVQGSILLQSNQPVVHLQLITGPGDKLTPALEGQSDALQPTSGSLHGLLEARDGALKALRDDFNALASSLITEVNAAYSRGFSPAGTTGALFFTGADASDIKVNASLVSNPGSLQASSSAAESSDNKILLQLSDLANKGVTSLGGKTFSQAYAAILTGTGQSLASTTSQLENQKAVETLLKTQRDSVSGISLDEEVTNLVKFQKAFQASARFITVTDELLDSIINLT